MKQEQLADLLGKVVPLRNRHVLTVKKIDLSELLNGVFRDWAEKAGSEDVKIRFGYQGKEISIS